MKFNKWILGLTAVAAVALALGVRAGGLGFDAFAATRAYVVSAPQNIGPSQSSVTNGPVDIVKSEGTGTLFFINATNTGTSGGTITATLYGSADTTNLVALSNFAVVQTSTDSITNLFYAGGGTNGLVANNSVIGYGTSTSPTAYSAGFNTPYIAPAQFTNSGAITLNGKTAVGVGLRITDLPRYLYVVYTTGGTVTNFTESALLLAPN
jgi:hypothetical protein